MTLAMMSFVLIILYIQKTTRTVLVLTASRCISAIYQKVR